MDDIGKRFSIGVRYFAAVKHIEIADLEESVGLSKGYLNRILKKESGNVSIETAMKIAAALRTGINYLFEKDETDLQEIKIRHEIEEAEQKVKTLKKQLSELNGEDNDREDC